jgi:hypothetical protein
MIARRAKPNKVRGRELEEVREVDPDGRIVVHHRTVNTLGRMLKSGSIDQAMYDAARAFQAAFAIAHFEPLRAASMLRIPGAEQTPELHEHQFHARRRIHDALMALGGLSSPVASCAWHVIGCGHSLREWALRQRWSGRSVDQRKARRMFILALELLARQYELRPRRTNFVGHRCIGGPGSARSHPSSPRNLDSCKIGLRSPTRR